MFSRSTWLGVVLVGPTAVGKTALSLRLAQRWNAEIVVADSLQVYRYLDIGTGKPSLAERQMVPHHLLDLVEPPDPFTAGDFRRLAEVRIKEIRERGRLPLIVGGCGLYIRALVDGLFSGSASSSEVRERLARTVREEGEEVLYQRLLSLDPMMAQKIHPHDSYRLVRALEIFETTQRRPSEVRGVVWPRRKDVPFLMIGLWRPRSSLYRLIEERIENMMEAGFLQEVRMLICRYSVDCKPLGALGYSHLISYLQGRWGLEEAISRWKRDTRRYSKRQMTWFGRDERIQWVSLEPGEEKACQRIEEIVARSGEGG